MNKYKKIFSGLGLLSISTLIGASVVACARTKVEKEETPAPGTSDSKDLATIKNEASAEVEKLQGHEKYAELKAIIDKENATIEELNSAKTSAIEELNNYKNIVQTAIEAITDNTKKEELKKEIETANSYNDLKTIKDKIEPKSSPDAKPENDGKDNPDKKEGETDSSNQGKNEGSTGKDNNGKTEPEKDEKNEGGNQNNTGENSHTPAPKVMTVDEKVTELYSLVDQFPYPTTETKVEDSTKTSLKNEVKAIKDKTVDDNTKLQELNILETKFKEYKTKIEKYKEIIDNPKFKSNKYDDSKIKALYGSLVKLFNKDLNLQYTEDEFIWNVYETFRRISFDKNSQLTQKRPKVYEYGIVPDREKEKSSKFEVLGDNKKMNHGIKIEQLEQKINNIVDFVISIAKQAANLNIDKIKYTNSTSDAEKPNMLIEKLKGFVSATTNLADIDTLIDKIKQIVSKVQEVVTSATNNKDANIKDKINKIAAKNIDEVITELGKLKPASSTPSKAN
ncbi:hypothetical protein [Mycoplasmopsis cynos]|uniref:hypothetical protein n=1 Tax=Mycoplasmopsis cynos TaxID=171284 RepID=UPI0030D1735F